jgi:hypothetical protein
VAVCLLPGTELAFEKEVQRESGRFWHSLRQVEHKLARFRQINKDQPKVHHDALEFPDGQIVSPAAHHRAAEAQRHEPIRCLIDNGRQAYPYPLPASWIVYSRGWPRGRASQDGW